MRRFLKINDTVLINAGTVSSIRTRGRLGHSFNVVDIFSNGKIKVVEKNLSKQKNSIVAEF